MDKNQFSPNAISHKELNALLTQAKKDIPSKETPFEQDVENNQEFNDLIKEWTNISKKILLILNKTEILSRKKSNTKSLIAFGAMGAHINMALLALKSTEFNQ